MVEDGSDKRNEAFFLQLVLTFQTAAWQQMGKLKNPLTDRIEKDLNQVRFSIDMLEMIRAKTQGNLTENEKQFLNKAISELQLNYIAEVEKEKKEKEQEKPEEKEEKKEEKKTGETKEEKKPKESEKPPKTRPKRGSKKQTKKK